MRIMLEGGVEGTTMTSTDSNEPNADEFDEALANAISSHQTDEQVIENARIVALYYTTLTENDVPAEHALDLTHQWVAIIEGGEG
jgi:hypothetical protein